MDVTRKGSDLAAPGLTWHVHQRASVVGRYLQALPAPVIDAVRARPRDLRCLASSKRAARGPLGIRYRT